MPRAVHTKNSRKKAKKKKKAFQFSPGWLTSDEEEIILRKQRAQTKSLVVKNLHPDVPYFSTFEVSSSTSTVNYHVAIFALTERHNSCECLDFRGNQLGTCKHIEKVLLQLKKSGVRAFKAAATVGFPSPYLYCEPTKAFVVRIQWTSNLKKSSKLYQKLAPYFDEAAKLQGDTALALLRLQNVIKSSKGRQSRIVFSPQVLFRLQMAEQQAQCVSARQQFLADVKEGKRSLDVLQHPLYPYQKEGALHLAFNERALLADEMGLGKTIQALGAVALLHQLKHIQRVLVIATSSLKAEWKEQIEMFYPSPVQTIYGNKIKRQQQYQQPSFFYLSNYEQILRDAPDIQHLLAPDVIIIDEAQRIKNWRTKTAQAIKTLKSRYLFVLTGTPLENRIDDIYSLVQLLDPMLFGALFRFNQQFYQLDESGRPMGYKNLNQLHKTLEPLLLRRLKHEIETQLPERTIKHHFVPMHKIQSELYDSYKQTVAALAHKAQRRPLLEPEMKRLQKSLACMRMVCDSPYILDENCTVAPKCRELKAILTDLLTMPETKILIFSEWERMLQLIHQRLPLVAQHCAWHTGSIDQQKRREEINRFKSDPNCRIFLSTDAGSVGLNLQVARVVINVDLPWNPARLEQRIARAWRKHQAHPVHVIHLITQETIEHRMLSLLSQKQTLAESVLNADSPIDSMELPSGRQALLDRLQNLLPTEIAAEATVPSDPQTSEPSWSELKTLVKETVTTHCPQTLAELSVYSLEGKDPLILAVAENFEEQTQTKIQNNLAQQCPQNTVQLEWLDTQTLKQIKRLAALGVLELKAPVEHLYQVNPEQRAQTKKQQQLEAAQRPLQQAQRKLKMAHVLLSHEFFEEMAPCLQEVLIYSLHSLIYLAGMTEPKPFPQKVDLLLKILASSTQPLHVDTTLITTLQETLAHCSTKQQALTAMQQTQSVLDGAQHALS